MRHRLTIIKGSVFVLALLVVLALTFSAIVIRAQQTCAPNSLYPPGTSPAPFFNGMVAWWPATENSLETNCPGAGCPGYNDIIGGNNGTPVGGATFAAGEVGQAFSLNGTTASVQVPDSPGLNLGAGEITVDAWINAPPGNTYRVILGKVSTSYTYPGYFLRVEADGTVAFAAVDCGTGSCGFSVCGAGGAKQPVCSTSRVDDGKFHHVAGVRRSDGTRQIYVDGVSQNTRVETNWITDNTNALYIGDADGTDQELFNGLIDEAQVFNRALSDSEIKAIYNAGSHGLCPQAHFGDPTLGIPTPMGVSIGNTPAAPSTCKTTPCANGTAGLLVYSTSDPSQEFILSSNHVLSAVGPKFCPGSAAPGTWTLQPGTGDLGTNPGNDEFYHVASFTSGITNSDIDAGLSQLVDSIATIATTEIFGIGEPNPHVGVAYPGEPVTKSGEHTGVTTGTVDAVNSTFPLIIPKCRFVDVFNNQITIISTSSGPFSGPGDSGSAVLDAATLTPVGLLVGRNPFGNKTVANPINKIYVELGVFPEGPAGTAPKTQREVEAEVQASNASVDPRLVRLEEIQTRHENEVLRIPGVQGIGIGLDEKGQDLVFHVYVIERTPALTAVVPQEIEEVPVRLVETGGEFGLL